METAAVLALLGSSAAGLLDLKTTEVPEEIPALMISFGIFYWFVSALTFGDFYPLFLSMAVGTGVLLFGLLMYKRGQWGEADAWILAAIAYMLPVYGGGMFMPGYLVNFFLVGAAYTIIYAVALGFRHPVFPHFMKDMKGSVRLLLLPLAFAAAALFLGAAYGINTSPLLYSSLLIALLIVFWRYGKTVEQRVFRKRVSTRLLKEGDVVQGMIWRGLTKQEAEKLRKQKRYVTVKEGVRFVPVFPITILVTVLYGNLLFLLAF